MTARTLSLFLLFVIALGVSAVLVAAVQPMAVQFDASTPWSVPMIALVCYSVTLFAGRRHILPGWMSDAAGPAFAALIVITVGSMGLAYGLVRLAHTLIGAVPAGVALLIWFGTLWLGVGAAHRAGYGQ